MLARALGTQDQIIKPISAQALGGRWVKVIYTGSLKLWTLGLTNMSTFLFL